MKSEILIITLFFIFQLLIAITLFADGIQPIGSGTEVDPYQVEILDNLLWVSTTETSWDSYFIQIADIDASETVNWNNGEGFNPIGNNQDNSFSGNYNGQNHTISNLFINHSSDNTGYFGYIYSASIQYLNLENANITGDQYSGIVFGKSHDSILNGISISGDIVGNYCVGGLAGLSFSDEISNCSGSITVNGGSHTGGLIGINYYSDINDCFCNGNVFGLNDTGGFSGYNNGVNILNSYFNGNVEGSHTVGGFVGANYESSVIFSCYSFGNVTGEDFIGGFVGDLYGEYADPIISNCFTRSNVEGYNEVGGFSGVAESAEMNNCYSSGYVNGLEENVGGLIGYGFALTINNSFWDIDTSVQTTSAGGTGKTTAEMMNVATYTSLATIGLDEPWDFEGNPFDDTANEDYWNIDSGINNGYPYLVNPLVNNDDNEIPEIVQNLCNFPNPFNPTTTIEFSIQNDSEVDLSIFNIRGQKIKTLAQNDFSKGTHSFNWNGDDESGKHVGSGLYLYKLKINNKIDAVKKCMLLK